MGGYLFFSGGWFFSSHFSFVLCFMLLFLGRGFVCVGFRGGFLCEFLWGVF